MSELNKGFMVAKVLKQILGSIRQNVGQEFKKMNLTGPQGMLVGILAHHGSMKISDLSERLGLSNSTVSGIVDRLEKQRFVERIRSEEDRRVVQVDLTSDFKKTAKNQFSQIEKNFEAILNEATPEEVNKIFEGLNLLKELMESQRNKE
ncbi:MAG: MarR family transcriptional regulator [Bacillota bacterium]|nr:MarR family transcriptional regulator [Bacillota bacterium]